MNRRLRPWAWFAVAVALGGMVWLYGSFDPATTPFPRCLFKVVTGWDCPGCGSQRALHAALHGHFGQALRYNALLALLAPLLLALALAPWMGTRWPRVYRVVYSTPFILALLGVIVVFTVVRNLF